MEFNIEKVIEIMFFNSIDNFLDGFPYFTKIG